MERYIKKNQKNLKCGVTTGTCAAAAAKAAASCLLLGICPEYVQIDTPKGVTVKLPVSLVLKNAREAVYAVQKESGDDPDVTNHCKICVSVLRVKDKTREKNSFSDGRYPNLTLEGGAGVGRATREGLELEVGQAAINVTPRNMIFGAVGEICDLAECAEELLITVSVPEGEALAKRTFNPKLGIIGGISILGTSGILEPMSEKAILDTIELQIRQLSAQGKRSLLVTPGNYGQNFAESFLKLDLRESVKCSNFIGDTLDLAVSYGMEKLLLVGNIGKLVKLAANIMNTHSKTADARREILALHTCLCGGSREMAQKIMSCTGAEEILLYLEEWRLRDEVMKSICRKIEENVRNRVGGDMKFGVILFSEKFGLLGQTADAQELLSERVKRG